MARFNITRNTRRVEVQIVYTYGSCDYVGEMWDFSFIFSLCPTALLCPGFGTIFLLLSSRFGCSVTVRPKVISLVFLPS